VSLTVRAATVGDIDDVWAIEQTSFPDPWSRELLYTHMLSSVHVMLVAERNAAVAGYAIAQIVLDESELLDVAVHPESRNRGIGGALLRTLMDRCRERGAVCMLLDVREANHSARTVYERLGFTQVGRRRNYYDRPREDALLMRASLIPRLDVANAVN
jgi:ribosomal-protein-alanine N-acetyltransferase